MNLNMNMPQTAPTSVPDVDDLIKSMRVRVGLEQVPQDPVDPFMEQPTAPVTNQETLDWMPIQEDFDKKGEDQELASLFMNSDIYKKLEPELDSFIEALGDEVVNIETPFGTQEAEEQLVRFLNAKFDEEFK